MRNSRLQRKQLESVFSAARALEIQVPRSGWLYAIRSALEMPLKTIAKRLGITVQGAKDLEMREANGNVTLNKLRQAAEALNCRLVYVLIPNEPLETMLETAANSFADNMMKDVSNSMSLEGQATTSAHQQDAKDQLVEELKSTPRRIWRG